MMKKKRGPFVVLGTKEIYKNPWIRVREDQVIRPNGKEGIFGVVEYQSGVQVVALDGKGFCYLTREYHYGVDKITTEVIAGGREPGETPLQAAQRECREETGLTGGRWRSLGVFHPLSTILSAPQHIFLALGVKKTERVTGEDKKLIRVIRVPLQKAVAMVHRHRIDIAPSMVAILRAGQWLQARNYEFKMS